MKRFIELWLSNYQWARAFHGGRWVRKKEPGYEWVTWNDTDVPWGELKDWTGWPLDLDEFECESYP